MSKPGPSILCLFLALAGGVKTITAQSTPVQVQVYDYATLDPEALRRFLSAFQSIWKQVGLSVQVSVCRGALAVSCESQPGSPDPLVLRLRPRYPKNAKDARRTPLGHSFVNEVGGLYSSVFLNTAKDQAEAANVSWVMVLAYGAAHEMGHLLLGPQAHSPRGVMRAIWDRGDYEAMAQGRCRFTDEQIRQLARR